MTPVAVLAPFPPANSREIAPAPNEAVPAPPGAILIPIPAAAKEVAVFPVLVIA